MIDAEVIAELALGIGAFLGAAGDSHGACTFQLCELSDDRADRAGRGGDHDRVSLLRRDDLVQPVPSGDARHADDAEISGERDLRSVDLH